MSNSVRNPLHGEVQTVSALDDIAMCILPDYRFFLKDYLKKLNNTHNTAETPHA
jgi:hypothetical protein